MTRTLALAALFLTAALPAAADITIDGSAEACAQEHSDSRITLGDSMVSFWESSCDIAARTTDANGAEDLALSCSGEGETWTTLLRVERTATGYRLTGDGGATDYVLCN